MLQHSFKFEAIGTAWQIDTSQNINEPLRKLILDRIEAFDATYSRFRADSLISQVAKQAGAHTFTDDSVALFDFYKQMYDATNGKVTLLIGNTLSQAGYDADYSFIATELSRVAEWHDVLSYDNTTLVTTRPVLLDFGAAGKGYLIDLVGEILSQHAINEYVIDASGDLKHRGNLENKVGLEHPLDTSQIIGIVDVRNKSLCASASNRRAWGGDMHHIFDPHTLLPVKEIIASWVIADEAMVADGLATALFFEKPSVLSEIADFEYVRMFKDGGVEYSSYFADKLF